MKEDSVNMHAEIYAKVIYLDNNNLKKTILCTTQQTIKDNTMTISLKRLFPSFTSQTGKVILDWGKNIAKEADKSAFSV